MAIMDRDSPAAKVCQECKITNKFSIYQCPRCNIRTCSLECVKSHKQRTQCTGKRNRSAYLPLSKMTDSTLRSDYFFLEEVLDRMPSSSSKNEKNKRAKTDASNLTKKYRRLLQQCERRDIQLQVMPAMMERHKHNNSWYCSARDMITWKVEIIVVQKENEKSKNICFQMSENEDDIMSCIQNQCQKQGMVSNDDKTSNIGHCNYRLLLKKLPASAKSPQFFPLNENDTMKEFLKNKTVIEYPTIYCVETTLLHNFPLVATIEKVQELSSSSSSS